MQSSFFRPVLTALFTALIAVGSWVAIPVAPVPVVLANFFVLLSGLMLGPFWGGLSVLLYLGLGAIGLPVFSGGTGGFAHFLTPTGGFLLGYLAAALLAGLVAWGPRGFDRHHQPAGPENAAGAAPAGTRPAGIVRLILAGLAGLAVMYLIGLPWFQAIMGGKNPAKFPDLLAAALFMVPYLAGDLVKTVVAVALARSLRPLLK
jgi:biotin transport system substrate-specific component